MSKKISFREINEQKQLLVATADLQRATILLIAHPVCKIIRATEAGILAVKTSRAVFRYIQR